MPRLRDYFFSDLTVFFNESEFAEDVEIEGTTTKVIIDNDTLKELKIKNGGEGLTNSELLFHVKKEDWNKVFSDKPFCDQSILFNNRFYSINDVQESDGLYTITLEAPEG